MGTKEWAGGQCQARPWSLGALRLASCLRLPPEHARRACGVQPAASCRPLMDFTAPLTEGLTGVLTARGQHGEGGVRTRLRACSRTSAFLLRGRSDTVLGRVRASRAEARQAPVELGPDALHRPRAEKEGGRRGKSPTSPRGAGRGEPGLPACRAAPASGCGRCGGRRLPEAGRAGARSAACTSGGLAPGSRVLPVGGAGGEGGLRGRAGWIPSPM